MTTNLATVECRGVTYALAPARFKGAVDTGYFRDAEILLGGWATFDSEDEALVIAVAFNGNVIAHADVGLERADIARALGQNHLRCGFRFHMAAPISAQEFRKLKFYALAPKKGVAGDLSIHRGNYFLDLVPVGQDAFSRLISNPATRIRDSETLLFLAREYSRRCERFEDLVAAICVIGYRVLEKMVANNNDYDFALNETGRALSLYQLPLTGIKLRWYVSLRLLRGHLFLLAERRQDALLEYEAIIEKSDQIQLWPSLLTNMLKAVFISGWLLRAVGRAREAIERWRRALPLVTKVAPMWGYENYYSYSELSQSITLARECFLLAVQVDSEEAMVPVSPTVVPTAAKIDWSITGFPTNQFHQRGLL